MLFLKLLLIFHILGYFYFQKDRTSLVKKEKKLLLTLSILMYAIAFIPLFWISNNIVLVIVTILSLSFVYYIFDLIGSKINNLEKEKRIFFINQIVHILFVVAFWLMLKDTFTGMDAVNSFFLQNDIQISVEKIISIILILLIIIKPAALIVEKCLPKQSSDETESTSEKEKSESNVNYGGIIGVLERVTIALLAILNLWSSIALVLTAKSIARFKQLEDKNFAQKYLIGTLLSLIITLLTILLFL
ncbi:conserved hypothetical protein [Alteracholeplasma palmae J233]|uniref:DUF3307 domain-containing protein n=1 Tax=Alteracholeplasma palmae (strain ATCC 49389 / J233) TaxID=1318466 RepID=U4KJS4_ALTPJ|nr:DUF3307 domain-containing protein [Alteracholeplasma palmae]CCV63692.1 conserved hypothetical protein [Alteracholeplasma palmae J233]